MVLLDEYQVRRAASALLKHVQRSRSGSMNMLEEDGDVIIAQISLHKIPDKVTAKPIPITIPHPLHRQDDCDMCLFVKDDAKAWIKEMVEKEPMVGLAKVLVVLNSHLPTYGFPFEFSILFWPTQRFSPDINTDPPISNSLLVSSVGLLVCIFSWLSCPLVLGTLKMCDVDLHTSKSVVVSISVRPP